MSSSAPDVPPPPPPPARRPERAPATTAEDIVLGTDENTGDTSNPRRRGRRTLTRPSTGVSV